MHLRKLGRHILELFFPATGDYLFSENIDLVSLTQAIHIQTLQHPQESYSLLNYSDPSVRACIKSLKYRGTRYHAEVLAHVLHEFLIEELAERATFDNFREPLLVPIPLHPARLRSRGFNQVEWIARELLILNPNIAALCTHALVRTKNTKSQARQDTHKNRMRNLTDAFSVKRPEHIRGRNIILLDDVITTGSTMTAAQKELLNAGARQVLCIALAH